MKQCYVPWRPEPETQQIIARATAIIEEYQQGGAVTALTVRQVYYQFVARGYTKRWTVTLKTGEVISGANHKRSYERLQNILKRAREAGLLDWGYIEDRTRDLHQLPTWENARTFMQEAVEDFRLDPWASQPTHLELWSEKDALCGVFEQFCDPWLVPVYACRGYDSTSKLKEAAERFINYAKAGQRGVILYFGDHDPSGTDMTRDHQDRLERYGADAEVKRLGLTMEQVREYNPPAQFPKESDARTKGYKEEFGARAKCWELDALPPDRLTALVREAIEAEVDMARWNKTVKAEQRERRKLVKLARKV